MQKDQVRVRGRYTAKVSGSVVPVEIKGERWVGDQQRGWDAVNTETGRAVVIKSAQRLRAEVAPGSAGSAPAPEAKPATTDATGGNVAAQRRSYPPPADAKPGRAIKVIGAKPVVLSDKAAYVVDRRTPPEAIPALEREVARINSAGSPKPPPAKGKKKAAKPAKPKGEKRMSGLDACAKVLADSGKPMGAKQMVERAIEKGLWKSGGKTPAATIYAAIIRDIAARGKESRFKKVDRGLFASNGKGG